LIWPTTIPTPRGMPYRHHAVALPVAASLGFWLKHPDLDALSTLVLGESPDMSFITAPMYQKFFPFCGMNFAFRREWIDCATLVEGCGRYDDIWMGFVWQKVANDRGCCFNLGGPWVTHSRQSNVWKNLQEEVKYLEVNEDLWSAIHSAPAGLTASQLRASLFGFLPAPAAGLSPVPPVVSA
jgi:hypothetical protein